MNLDRRHIGRTDISVTGIGFGGAPIGNYGVALEDAAAQAALATAWDAGMRYFDTAPLYGTGLSENRIGAFLRGRPRETFVVSTKIGRSIVRNPAPSGAPVTEYGFHVGDAQALRWDFSRDGVRRSLEASLERLGLDRIDIAVIHDPDDHAEIVLREAYPELEAMRAEGLLGAIGVGMNQWELPLRFVRETQIDVVMLAGRYTLADQSGLPLLEACRERGVSIICAAPFNSGLLSRTDVREDATFNYMAAPQPLIEKVRNIARICSAHGVALPDAALRFPLRHPAVSTALPGIRTPAEAIGAARAAACEIPEALWQELRDAGLVDPAAP